MPLGVTGASNAATTFLTGYNSVFPSLTSATSLGGLSEDSTSLNALGAVDSNVSESDYSFNFEQGSAIKLQLSNYTNTTSLRAQLLDVTGNVIADNYGTSDQQTAYGKLASSDGLPASNGTYYVKISYAPNAATDDTQNYSLQLFSGTTYDNNIITSTQIQSYDPNLFVPSASSVTSSTHAESYAKSSTFFADASASKAISLGDLIRNKTDLSASSKITLGYPTNYFSFNFKEGDAIKLSFNNSNVDNPQALQVQLLDSSGKVVADNQGSEDLKNAYTQLTSGVGLKASTGKYFVKVSAVSGSNLSNNAQTYNFQLYSGSSYNQVYETTAKQPVSAKAGNPVKEGLDVGVFEAANAKQATQKKFNQINATASSAVPIGYLFENKTSLSVSSLLTRDDNEEYYSFVFQKGDAVKLDFTNATNTSSVRVQLLDQTGNYVYADNKGTDEQKKNYQSLTSTKGVELGNGGSYVIKIFYAQDTNKTLSQIYGFNLYSGTSFIENDKTTASAQNYQNALLSGNATKSYSSAAAAASYYSDSYNGTSTDIFGNKTTSSS